MVWIRIEAALPRHPKVLRVASILGIQPAQALGHLLTLWCWASHYRPDGNLSMMSNLEIADAAGWQGSADAFVLALTDGSVRLIDASGRNKCRKMLHDWGEYQGYFSRESERKARRHWGSARAQRAPAARAARAREEEKREDTPPTPSRGNRETNTEEKGPPGFERWWSIYPSKRRVDPRKCLKRWRVDGLEGRVEELIAVLEAQKRSPDWIRENGRFVTLSTTYLNQQRYLVDAAEHSLTCKRCGEPSEGGHEYCSFCDSQKRSGS